MIRVLSLFLTSFLIQNVYCQTDFRNGFIITTEGDTVKGFIDYGEGTKNFRSCKFRQAGNNDIVVYNPDQIMGFGFFNDKYLETRIIPTETDVLEKVFVEVLVKGSATLYKYRLRFFVQNNGNELHELTNEEQEVVYNGKKVIRNSNSHIGILSYLLSDCDKLKGRIERVRFDEKSLTKLIAGYNTCVGSSNTIFKEEKPWATMSYGFSIGFNSSLLKIESTIIDNHYLTAGFDRANSLIIGPSFRISAPRMNERISFNGNILYMSAKYLSNNSIQRSAYLERNDVNVELKQLKIPIGLTYSLPEKKLTPYASVGMSFTLHLSSSSRRIFERERDGIVQNFDEKAIDTTNNHFGYWFGLGIKNTVSPKLRVFFELRYEQTTGITQSYQLSMVKSNLFNSQILLGFEF